MGYTMKVDESSLLFSAVVGVVAFVGFMWQIGNGMQVPFPFSAVFFPVRLADSFLRWCDCVFPSFYL